MPTPENASELYKQQTRNIDATVDARRYGIVSSPSIDQTTAMQAMADDISLDGGGARRIILPAGDIHISAPILFDQAKGLSTWPQTSANYGGGVQVEGQGKHATTIIQDTDGVAGFQLAQTSFGQNMNDNVFKGFTLRGQGTSNSLSRGLMIGGVTVPSTDIPAGNRVEDVMIENFHTSLILDDATSFLAQQLTCQGYQFGVEMGFNIDSPKFLSCRFGSATIPVGVSCTTNGTTSVTTASTTDLRAAMGIQGSGIPVDTVIVSIDSPTAFTIDNSATNSATNNMDFFMGTAFSYGYGPFVPPSGTGIEGGNALNVMSTWIMRNRRAIEIARPSNANLKFDSCYSERLLRFASLGDGTNTSGMKNFILDNHHFSISSTFEQAVIYDDGSGDSSASNVIFRNCRSDTSSPVPWVRLRSSEGTLDWRDNTLNVSAGDKIHIFDGAIAFSPSNEETWTYGLGENIQFTKELGVSGTLTPSLIPNTSHNVGVGALTGNVTINVVGTGIKNAMKKGSVYTFVILESGTAGNTVTWNSAYIFHTAWVDSTVTVDANKRSIVQFYYDGNNFLQISPTNTWL